MNADQNNQHKKQDKKNGGIPVNSTVEITQPATHTFELEPRYRTRYGAWTCIILLWLASVSGVVWRGDALEWLLATVFSIIVITSGLLPRLGAMKLSYQRVFSTTTVHDEDLSIAIGMKRSIPVPAVWYVIYDKLNNTSTGHHSDLALRASFAPLFHTDMSLTYKLRRLSRGSYEAKQAVIFVGDWLGLTSIRVEIPLQDRFIVLPTIKAIAPESYVANTTSSDWLKTHSKKNHVSNSEPPTISSITSTELEQQLHAPLNGEADGDWSLRPYVEGDHYRRIDARSIAKGQAWQTLEEESGHSTPRLCHFVDQSQILNIGVNGDYLFDALIDWCLADTTEQGEKQSISVLTDNWNFDYWGKSQQRELQHLFAITRADVTMPLTDRLNYYAVLLPTNGYIVVYSGAWKEPDGWLKFAELAWMKGSRLEVQFVTTNRVMTYAMREQQKLLEAAGVKVVWRYRVQPSELSLEIEKGSEHYATGA